MFLLSFYLHCSSPIIPDSKVNPSAGQQLLRTAHDGSSVALWVDEKGLCYATAGLETSFSTSYNLHQAAVDCYNCSFDTNKNLLCVYSVGSTLYYHFGDLLEKFLYIQNKKNLSLPCSKVYASRMKFCDVLNKFILFLNTDKGIYLYYFDIAFSSPVFIYKNTSSAPNTPTPTEWVNFTTNSDGAILLNWIDLKNRWATSSVASPFTLKWTAIKDTTVSSIFSKEFLQIDQGYITQPAVFYNSSNEFPWTITFTQNYSPPSSTPQIYGFLLNSTLEGSTPKLLCSTLDGTAGAYIIMQRKANELILFYSKQNLGGSHSPYAAFFNPLELSSSSPELSEIKISDSSINSYLWKAVVSVVGQEIFFIYSDNTTLSYCLLPNDSQKFINFSSYKLESNISFPTIAAISKRNYLSRFMWVNNSFVIQTNPGINQIFRSKPIFTQR